MMLVLLLFIIKEWYWTELKEEEIDWTKKDCINQLKQILKKIKFLLK